MLNKRNKDILIQYYQTGYEAYGYDPRALGWNKGKQDLRFDILTSGYAGTNKHFLDIGCGFGDLNKTLIKKFKNYQYTGIDITPCMITEAEKKFTGKGIQFIAGDFLDNAFNIKCDYTILSGTLNYKLNDINQYEYAESVMKKAYECSRDGFAFDFLSDKVDYMLDTTFHYAPEKILEIAYNFSRNVCLRNDYMPFEFSLFIYKDNSFDKNDTVFCRYKEKQK